MKLVAWTKERFFLVNMVSSKNNGIGQDRSENQEIQILKNVAP